MNDADAIRHAIDAYRDELLRRGRPDPTLIDCASRRLELEEAIRAAIKNAPPQPAPSEMVARRA